MFFKAMHGSFSAHRAGPQSTHASRNWTWLTFDSVMLWRAFKPKQDASGAETWSLRIQSAPKTPTGIPLKENVHSIFNTVFDFDLLVYLISHHAG